MNFISRVSRRMSWTNLRHAVDFMFDKAVGIMRLNRFKKRDKLEKDFLRAVVERDFYVMNRCIKKGVNPNCFQKVDGYSALHIAAERGDFALILKLLLTCADLEIDPITYLGYTPLYVACQCEQLVVVKVLLKNGANPNARDTFGKTTLYMGILLDNLYMMRQLLRFGAQPNVVDVMENSPLHYAVLVKSYLPMVKLLYMYGADPNMDAGNMPVFLECVLACHQKTQLEATVFLAKHGTNINITDKIGRRNALHFVAFTGYVPLAKELLKLGCNPFMENAMMRKPIDMAIAYDNENVAYLLQSFMYPSESESFEI